MISRMQSVWNINCILESLPISSSGHLKLLTKFILPLKDQQIDNTTEHLMHIPNALIIGFFLVCHRSFLPAELLPALYFCASLSLTNCITGVVYLACKSAVEKTPLSFGFLITGISLLSLWYAPTSNSTEITLLHALVIGIAQTLALLPGMSRMALTTVTGVWLGIRPEVSFIYSASCQITLIVVAVAVALIKRGLKNSFVSLQPISAYTLYLSIVSFILAYVCLALSYRGFTHLTIAYLGLYLIVLSILTAIYFEKNVLAKRP